MAHHREEPGADAIAKSQAVTADCTLGCTENSRSESLQRMYGNEAGLRSECQSAIVRRPDHLCDGGSVRSLYQCPFGFARLPERHEAIGSRRSENRPRVRSVIKRCSLR
jgi:hypothetical protein